MGAEVRKAVVAAAVLASVLSTGCRRRVPPERLQAFDERLSSLQDRLDTYPPDLKTDSDRERLTEELQSLLRDLQEALERAPDDPELEWRIGECHRMGWNLDLPDAWKQSQTWLKRALFHDPKCAPAHESLGFLYVDTSEDWAPDAEKEFLEALRDSGGEREDSYYGLFFAELYQDKLEEALQAGDRYLEKEPGDREFRKQRDAVEDELEREPPEDSVGEEPRPPVKI